MKLGCFGFAVCFDADSEPCKSCTDQVDCMKKCQTSLDNAACEEAKVSDLQRKHQRWARERDEEYQPQSTVRVYLSHGLSAEQVAHLDKLAKSPAALLRTIYKQAIDIQGDLKVGVNSFKYVKPSYMQVVCDLLLQDKSHLHSKDLEAKLAAEYPHWSKSTTVSHASTAFKVLSELGIVERVGHGIYRMNK